MDSQVNKRIYDCIVYLREHGYEVREGGGSKIGKWVAYKKPGTEPIMHGVVIRDYTSFYRVKRKNAYKDVVGLDKVIAFFDDKDECYQLR